MNWNALFEYALCLIVPLAIVIVADRYFPVLRDLPADTAKTIRERPYSLGRVQMAFWTVIMVGSLIFIHWVGGAGSGAFPSLDPDLVALLGISGGTGLLAAAVDVTKDKAVEEAESKFAGTGEAIRSLDAQILALASASAVAGQPSLNSASINSVVAAKAVKTGELAQQGKAFQRSKRDDGKCSFFEDLLTDQNGNSMHRLQLVLFTLIFGAYVLTHVFSASASGLPNALKDLITPDQLALMGVASGVYVGFKVPGKTVS